MLYSPVRESPTQRKTDPRKLFKYLKDRLWQEEFHVVSQNRRMATAVRNISVQLKELANYLNCLKRK